MATRQPEVTRISPNLAYLQPVAAFYGLAGVVGIRDLHSLAGRVLISYRVLRPYVGVWPFKGDWE